MKYGKINRQIESEAHNDSRIGVRYTFVAFISSKCCSIFASSEKCEKQQYNLMSPVDSITL